MCLLSLSDYNNRVNKMYRERKTATDVNIQGLGEFPCFANLGTYVVRPQKTYEFVWLLIIMLNNHMSLYSCLNLIIKQHMNSYFWGPLQKIYMNSNGFGTPLEKRPAYPSPAKKNEMTIINSGAFPKLPLRFATWTTKTNIQRFGRDYGTIK